MWIFNTPPTFCTLAVGFAVTAGASSFTSSFASSAGASSAAGAFAPSTRSAVSGVRESQVLTSFAPSTCSIVSVPSSFRSPESTRSSKIAGSSRFAAWIVMPPSALQHNTAGSFACSFAVSAVIDIIISSLLI